MVMRLTDDTADMIMPTGPERNPVLFLIERGISHGGDPSPTEVIVRKAANALRGRVMICLADMESPLERRLGETAGIEDGQTDAVVTLIESMTPSGPHHQPKKYRPDMRDFTEQTLLKFVTDYEAGRLRTWLRSEPEPSDEDIKAGGAAIPIVGLNFYESAHDATKDVLVNFFAPWCGHCRKMEPLYLTLARKLKHVKTLRILKLDATRNEAEGMQIQGFPTIMLFKAGKTPSEMVQYQGNRQPDDMIHWLHEHVSIPFNEKAPAKVQTVDSAQNVDGAQLESGGLLDPSEEDL